jgi:uncharacterized phage protein (TIGR01671 family)
MRELKFRGKRLDNDEWVYGDFYRTGSRRGGSHHIIVVEKHDLELADEHHKVDAETVGQFTGLRDKKRTKEFPKGQEVWEGDIVEAIMNYHGKETDVKFNAKITYNSHIGAFQISYKNIDDRFVNDDIWSKYFLKVIGDIHENLELLK